MNETFERVEAAGPNELGLILVCDHASNRLPEEYGSLGMSEALLQTHIAYDIGAAAVTRSLAQAFGAPAILGCYSRLLIDLNRGADDPTLVMRLSDGSIIPGNRDADDAEIAKRSARYHAPYHAAIEAEIEALRSKGVTPVLLSLHSFTPSWKGQARPWETGVLWDKDPRFARPLLEELRAAQIPVGDNEPYSGELENDCMYWHGTRHGLPHVLLEMRQDLIGDETSQKAFAEKILPILKRALARMEKPALLFTRPLVTEKTIMDEKTREQLEAAAFRRLVAHLRERTDVQNIDLMNLAGFCRNCLGDWYREAASEKGIDMSKDDGREIVYGMPPAEWKKRYQKEASPEKLAAFDKSQKTHS
jgi:predicted N-formylglutamate amidohydrolase